MLHAFIDESYTTERFYLCAVLVHEYDLDSIADALNQARRYARGFGVTTPNIEFHAHSLMTGRDGWESVAGKFRAASSIYQRALRELANTPIHVFVRGIDVVRLNARYRYPEHPYQLALKSLAEHIDSYARGIGETVVLNADEVDNQARHSGRMLSFQANGTGGNWPRSLESLQLPMRFGPSHESPGVQAADLTVYLHRRIDAHIEANPAARRRSLEMWHSLEPVIRHVGRWDP